MGCAARRHVRACELESIQLAAGNAQGCREIREFAAGLFAEIKGLQSRVDLNGQVASLVQPSGDHCVVQVEDCDTATSLKPSHLSRIARPLPLTVTREGDLLQLANMVVYDFVEGPDSYP